MNKKLGVNIDHVAVLREARQVNSPNLLEALSVVEKSNLADQITIHLREDRRHIQDRDVYEIKKISKLPINLEASTRSEIINICIDVKPNRVTLVPENRQEVTTEGGLSLKNFSALKKIVEKLQSHKIEVSLFIDPNKSEVSTARALGVEWIEFHTGTYANLFEALHTENIEKSGNKTIQIYKNKSKSELQSDLEKSFESLKINSQYAKSLGLKVAMGHGLNTVNIDEIAKIPEVEEFNIGQSIIAQALFVGLNNAIKNIHQKINSES
jgi:pyridoxine 5-phosphate synthase